MSKLLPTKMIVDRLETQSVDEQPSWTTIYLPCRGTLTLLQIKSGVYQILYKNEKHFNLFDELFTLDGSDLSKHMSFNEMINRLKDYIY